jgi:hypothetical protein
MLSLVHTWNDADILAFPEIPSILAGYGTHIIDHIRGVTGDPYIGRIVDIDGIESDLGFRLREILSQPLNRLLSRTTNFIVILDF